MFYKESLIRHFDKIAPYRPEWFQRNFIYHKQLIDTCRQFMGLRVLELGCSTGDLLNALKPKFGVGVDISPESIRVAKINYPELHWICADVETLGAKYPLLDKSFDLIVISDLIAYVSDIQQLLEQIKQFTDSHTIVCMSSWNWMWQPILHVAEEFKLKAPDLHQRQNWLSPQILNNLLELAGYSLIESKPVLFLPFNLPPLSDIINSLTRLPILNHFALATVVLAGVSPQSEIRQETSVTVVIPTRNEVDNIEMAVERVPMMGTHTQLLFIDGNSTDGTVEEIQRQITLHPEKDIRFLPQIPLKHQGTSEAPYRMLKLGKGDAVRKAFATASSEIVMILDADLTVAPEDLPKFYNALISQRGCMINGTRFVYQQETGAMRLINKLGNIFFGLFFSWLLKQSLTDTLCGTKALYKRDYDAIAANRSYFGDFDPFGDFDLLFGAAWLKFPIKEIPVHYGTRLYGQSKVSVRSHGPLLGRMSLIALWQFKIRPVIAGRRSEGTTTR